ncbi:MAG: hypothetical protein NC079_09580 [Clostridium sp.]|nr:hypothetical protein [Acetatifactor muris]MCM1527602.1 hypothetical protein [Bacteroides sp.]MCM1563843.1 hypothetical protein [Clostridium sp.]
MDGYGLWGAGTWACTWLCGVWQRACAWTWSVGEICLTLAALFYIGSRDDAWSLRLERKHKICLLILCGVNGVCTVSAMEQYGGVFLLWNIFAGCLLAASVMDWWEKMVYRFVWWAAGIAAGISLVLFCCGGWEGMTREIGEEIEWGIGWETVTGTVLLLIGFVLLQHLWFSRFYGRADCHAFCVCAVMLAACGYGYADYLTHMAVVFGSLSVIQFCRGNIARNGQLKKPVALVPYITVGFWVRLIAAPLCQSYRGFLGTFLVTEPLWLDFMAGKWYI